MLTRALSVLALVCALGCNNVVQPTADAYYGPVPPNSTVPGSQADTIEYRVVGTPTAAVVRFSTSVDGLSQITTTLPYVVGFRSTAPSLFLSLEATPVTTAYSTVAPFMAVQIFVNGALFRESSMSTYSGTLSVNGTWRH